MRTRFLLGGGLLAALVSFASFASPVAAQPGPKDKDKFLPPKAGALKKYDDVITKDFTTLPGVFAVHRHEEKLFFEVPQEALGRLFLWQAEVAKGPGGGMFGSWGGATLGSAVLKFERRGNKLYLWKVGFSKRSDGKAVQAAVEASATDAIIAVFNVECEGKDRSAVINVSDTFVSGLPDLPISRASGSPGGSVDTSRSYLSEVKAFPTNIEVRAMVTFRAGGGFGPPGPGLGGGGGAPRSVTALVHHSLVILPETPMQGRLSDPRVGYFTEEFVDYSHAKHWAVPREYIARYRLEKKNPAEAVSEVVKPITFYLSKEIPEKWRPYMKKGVEDWAPAFEKAGFKNAIVCKDAPTRAEDPNWDPEDARHSVIRWVAEPIQNAMGPHVHDPRSGEVISAHIIFWHDIVKTSQIWYFLQCAAVDPKARKFPLPDDITGAMMRYICAHEVGHTLGLRHNHRASQAFSVSQLRDPKFCAEYGSVASIMSYGRCNYVAQPGDGVDPKHLLPKIGPYDNFAIEWGYKPITSAKSPDEERKTLDEWAAKQLDNPFLRYGNVDGFTGAGQVDPTVLTENIGGDSIQATTCGLKNLDCVLEYLLSATTEKGDDYELLEEMYTELLAQRSIWLSAVAKQVGGVVEYRTLGGRGGETFVRVPKDKQKEAVKYLLEHAFTTPTKLLNPGVVNQFRYTGTGGDIARQQRQLLSSLLSAGRLARLADAELLAPEKAYTAVELVNDLQAGLFSELKTDAPRIDPLRRQLQRAYLDLLKAEFQPPAPTGGPNIPGLIGTGRAPSELRAVARQSLGALAKQLEAAKSKAKDPATVAHLDDLHSEITALLSADKKK